MAKNYGTWNKLKKRKDEDLKAGKDAQSSRAIAAWENIQKGWKNLIPDNRKGAVHTGGSRQEMSKTRKRLWQDHKFSKKMWRARRRRQYREQGKCVLRFPRLPSSVDKEWLKIYRKSYHRITGKHLGRPDVTLDPPAKLCQTKAERHRRCLHRFLYDP
jgi:hypothetical protein